MFILFILFFNGDQVGPSQIKLSYASMAIFINVAQDTIVY